MLLSACAPPQFYHTLPEANVERGNVTVNDSTIGSVVPVESVVSSGQTVMYDYNLDRPLSGYIASSLKSDSPVTVELLSIEILVDYHFNGDTDYDCAIVSSIQGDTKFNRYRHTVDEGFSMSVDVGDNAINWCLDNYTADTQKGIDAL